VKALDQNTLTVALNLPDTKVTYRIEVEDVCKCKHLRLGSSFHFQGLGRYSMKNLMFASVYLHVL